MICIGLQFFAHKKGGGSTKNEYPDHVEVLEED